MDWVPAWTLSPRSMMTIKESRDLDRRRWKEITWNVPSCKPMSHHWSKPRTRWPCQPPTGDPPATPPGRPTNKSPFHQHPIEWTLCPQMATWKVPKCLSLTTYRIREPPPQLYSRLRQNWIQKDTDWDLSKTTEEYEPIRATGLYWMSTVPITSIWDSRKLRMLLWNHGRFLRNARLLREGSRLIILPILTLVLEKSRKARDPWRVRTSTYIRWTIWMLSWLSLIVKAYCLICRSKEMELELITRMWGQMNWSVTV